MKFALYLIIIIFFSCNTKPKETPQKSRYYITVEQNQQDLFTGRYEKASKTDTIEAVSDSAAFWEGVKTFAANKMAEAQVRKAGVKNPPYVPFNFYVENSDGVVISKQMPAAMQAKAREFINDHTD